MKNFIFVFLFLSSLGYSNEKIYRNCTVQTSIRSSDLTAQGYPVFLRDEKFFESKDDLKVFLKFLDDGKLQEVTKDEYYDHVLNNKEQYQRYFRIGARDMKYTDTTILDIDLAFGRKTQLRSSGIIGASDSFIYLRYGDTSDVLANGKAKHVFVELTCY